MKKITIVEGEICHVQERITKNGKKYFEYQLETDSDKGKRLGYVKSWEDRGFKKGDKIMAGAFENSALWNGEVMTSTVLLSAEEEKIRFSSLGINPAAMTQEQKKMKL